MISPSSESMELQIGDVEYRQQEMSASESWDKFTQRTGCQPHQGHGTCLVSNTVCLDLRGDILRLHGFSLIEWVKA